jgi:hypothetical protein
MIDAELGRMDAAERDDLKNLAEHAQTGHLASARSRDCCEAIYREPAFLFKDKLIF